MDTAQDFSPARVKPTGDDGWARGARFTADGSIGRRGRDLTPAMISPSGAVPSKSVCTSGALTGLTGQMAMLDHPRRLHARTGLLGRR